jgi:hypothetical protein
MTTFELTWQQDHNRVPGDQTTVALQSKWDLWFIPSFLLGNIGGAASGLWTHEGSSDSATAGFDATNRFLLSFDATKIVRGPGGAVRSWIVLKSPVGLGPFYMLLDYNTSHDYQINATFSKSAFSGGSTTTLPTASNSWTYAALQLVPSVLAAQHTFARLSTSGEWHIQFGTDSTAKYTFALSFFTLAEAKTGDSHNGWSYGEYSASGVWLAATINNSSSSVIKGRSATPATAQVAAKVPFLTDSAGTNMLNSIGNADAVDGFVNDHPIYIHSYTALHLSKRGRVRDLYVAPNTATTAMVEPVSGPPYESAVVGGVWMPYNASTAPSL